MCPQRGPCLPYRELLPPTARLFPVPCTAHAASAALGPLPDACLPPRAGRICTLYIMARFTLLAAVLAVASAFQAPVTPLSHSKLAMSRVAPAQIVMEEPSDKAVVVGAAAVGGVVGVYLFHELSTGLFLAAVLAYGATLTNGFGSAAKSAGSAASKVYSKTLELNEQYDVLPKAKSALDTVTTAAGNLNENYGISAKIDDQLKISRAVDKIAEKVEDVKTSVSDKVSDLKSKASSTE